MNSDARGALFDEKRPFKCLLLEPFRRKQLEGCLLCAGEVLAERPWSVAVLAGCCRKLMEPLLPQTEKLIWPPAPEKCKHTQGQAQHRATRKEFSYDFTFVKRIAPHITPSTGKCVTK